MGYDMMPWKLVFCSTPWASCEEADPDDPISYFHITDLPQAPAPGRIPEGCDHLHVRPRYSGDQGSPREDHKWRTLLQCTVRCEHGRNQGDSCYHCPGGTSPLQEGRVVGYYLNGERVVAPGPQEQYNIEAWKREF